ncbi:MAG: flagellar basal body rod protein FlgC [Proteobacteria bacterium]|nr:flagellar basal body rod protein FlgC [Pseudomonadota bacterium]
MSLLTIFDISGSALMAQSQRLNTVASNLANADSITGPDGNPYRAKQVVFNAVPMGDATATGVEVGGVIEDHSPPRMIYDPRHPAADNKGYVTMPNIDVADQMVDMISASRSYQTNVEIMNTAKALVLKTLTIGQ